MARARGKLQRFNFSKGWNTEANAMTFPENTAQDLDNVVLDVDGAVRRRSGVNYDSQSVTFGTQPAQSYLTTRAIGMFKWENVAGSGLQQFVVSQVGTDLYFHAAAGQDTLDNYIGTVDFSSYIVDGYIADARNSVVTVASGLGYLFVTGQYIDPFYVAYDSGTGTLSATAIEIKIRDFDGVEDSLDIDERPSTLTTAHEYNLRNQGWVESFDCAVNGGSDATTDPVDFTFTHLGVYPSNADILYLGKAGSGTDEDDIGRYDPKTMAKNAFGTTQAPRGKFILNAFDKDRNALVSGAGEQPTDSRPQAVGFHNGRVFYAGIFSAGKTGEVYYSQQLTNINKVGRCYQEQDPTAEEFNELLATDGGLLVIPDAGNILALKESGSGILAFASNGVWMITGENGKFSADNFFVKKITDIGVLGKETIINADGTWMFWSLTGIIALAGDQITGDLKAEVVSKNTIQKGYLSIGSAQQEMARGAYIKEEKKCIWIYSTNSGYDGVNNRFKYNGVLIFDIQLGAFYKYSVSDPSVTNVPYMAGIAELPSYAVTTVDETVTVNGSTVTSGGETVTVSGEGFDSGVTLSTAWKILVVRPSVPAMSFGEFSSLSFTDWYLADGTGATYSSYIETGYELGGETMLDKQPKYVHTYLNAVSKTQGGGYYGLGAIPTYDGFCGNLSNATLGDTYDTSNENVTPAGFTITNSGNDLYVNDQNDYTLHQYTLGSGYEIETATYDSVSYDYSSDTSSSALKNIRVFSSGTRLLGMGSNETVYSFTLGTAYDLSTLTLDSSEDLNALTGDTGFVDMSIAPDGSVLYALTSSAEMYKLPLGTDWDVSTAVFLPTLTETKTSPDGSPVRFSVSMPVLTDNYLFLFDYDYGSTGKGYLYDKDTYAYTSNTVVGPAADYGLWSYASTDRQYFITDKGSAMVLCDANGFYVHPSNTLSIGAAANTHMGNRYYARTGNTFVYVYSINTGDGTSSSAFSKTGGSGTEYLNACVINDTHVAVSRYTNSISDTSSAVSIYDMSGTEVATLTNPGTLNWGKAMFWNEDTNKLAVCGNTGTYGVYFYDVSNPASPSLLSNLTGAELNFTNTGAPSGNNLVQGNSTGAYGVLTVAAGGNEALIFDWANESIRIPIFSHSGTRVLLDNNGDYLITGSGATLDQNGRFYDLSSSGAVGTFAGVGTAASMWLRDTEDEMFVLDTSDDTISYHQWSTAGDVSTISAPLDSLDLSSDMDAPNSVELNEAGTKVYILDGSGATPASTIYEYDMDCT